ncbi:hypothetical protein BDZ94DRAFT_1367166 [Collybia nuda]|uniref:SET domain-containing protein n=1 Tax=Collybia nuda TaxID=64659 RepID=A0A9P5Y583_9AGAR|nr:hypothetical protein BDZ94DRAFT_1367166 [Collybia nuda]
MKSFIKWFQMNHGFVDVSALDIANFPAAEGGRGIIAIREIPVGHTLFTIPRLLTLSTRTSRLPSIFGEEKWKKMKLGEGWVGLILCMMWETASGPSSKWFEYLATLPTRFDTPMFWDEHDLGELAGTSLVEKLGRADAEQSYREKLLPAIESRPDLFPHNLVAAYYSLEMYHIMGSRILSRSFNVERWDSAEGEDEIPTTNSGHEDSMDVDYPEGGEDIGEPRHAETEGDGEEEDNVEEDDAENDPSDIAMVPMADLLNARYGSENAKLYYEEHELKMVSTKPIETGEQIWNTYGDLPNSELLRRYGHVDLLPLPQGEGNPGDVVEVRADIVVSSIARKYHTLSSEASQERIDWWLEEGGDDVFILESDLELPPALVSLIRILLLPGEGWEKIKAKGNPPKPKIDNEVLAITRDVITARAEAYPTSISDDEKLLSSPVTENRRHAIVVRIGEKKILRDMVQQIGRMENRLKQEKGKSKRKSRDDTNETLPSKKSRK